LNGSTSVEPFFCASKIRTLNSIIATMFGFGPFAGFI